MKAIIHIGMPKTGSSSIQKWLGINRAALKAKGVHTGEGMFREKSGYYPQGLKWAIFHIAVHEFGIEESLAWLGNRRHPEGEEKIYEHFRPLIEQFEKLSGESGIFIHSEECLYKSNLIHIYVLDKFLSNYFDDISYVVYIRDTVDFFVSMYQQKLQDAHRHEDATLGYSEFLKKCASELIPYVGLETSYGNLFNWSRLLENKFNVRLLESDWLINGDLIEDFASLIGFGPLLKPRKINESIAAEYIEYVRFLNHETLLALPRKVRSKAFGILRSESIGKPKLAASDAQANSIRYIHSDLEERIRKSFFSDRTYLFSPKSRGSGVSPLPLTERRKRNIDSIIRENMDIIGWEPY